MDILVKMDDGSIANVEIQKIPYAFPGERMSCYSSDLLLRQYSRVKREKGRDFTYKGMKKYILLSFLKKVLPYLKLNNYQIFIYMPEKLHSIQDLP